MRKLAFMILLAVASARPAFGGKHVTIAELEQILNTLKGKSDSRTAHELSGLELTERVSSVRLSRWEGEFPGSRTREAFTLLVDASAFLEVPAEDIPSASAPDSAAQQAIFEKAVAYVRSMITKLPNFYANRETTYFNESPPRPSVEDGYVIIPGGKIVADDRNVRGISGDQSQDRPLHFAGRSSMTVAYRDGAELTQSQTSSKGNSGNRSTTLTTQGEFGPILTVVLADATHGTLTWDHWEQKDKGRDAVFRYTVPEERSHYAVMVPNGQRLVQALPAYHGEIVVDAASGTIMRLSATADFKAHYEPARAAILVEYSPVAIGDRTYVCPVKGVALSKMPAFDGQTKSEFTKVPSFRTELNDVVFTQFHLFYTQSRILDEK